MAESGQQGFRVIRPGILTLVQDLGRRGHQHLGLAPGGAADEHAFLWANRLLGNRPDSAALEIAYGGLTLEARVATRFALTGADLGAECEGRPLANWATGYLRPGERLRFGHPRSGVRAYLAVAGGFRVEPSFGSVATVMREGLGGLDGDGSPLAAGDWLPCAASAPGPTWRVPARYVPDYRQPLTLGVVAHPRAKDWFSEGERERFYRADYRLSSRSDRMGARLEGEPLRPECGGIVSEGIPFGAIQVPPNGQPIVLLKDRQSIGGYPLLGRVDPLDAFQLAQRQAGERLRLRPVSPEQCHARLAVFRRFLG